MNEYTRAKRSQKYGIWIMIVGVWFLIFAGDGNSTISMVLFIVGLLLVTVTGIVVMKSTKKLKALKVSKDQTD